ncbi:MAG: hypothetical protein AB1609_20970 [Bacillota bacterium]
MLFYRVVSQGLGPEHLFRPCGYYEKVGVDGEVVVAWFGESGTSWCSNVPEVCFGSPRQVACLPLAVRDVASVS